jgi:hypothetical protein
MHPAFRRGPHGCRPDDEAPIITGIAARYVATAALRRSTQMRDLERLMAPELVLTAHFQGRIAFIPWIH